MEWGPINRLIEHEGRVSEFQLASRDRGGQNTEIFKDWPCHMVI